jgi:hypothetical protein
MFAGGSQQALRHQMHWCNVISMAPPYDAVVQLNRKDYRILRMAINIVSSGPLVGTCGL